MRLGRSGFVSVHLPAGFFDSIDELERQICNLDQRLLSLSSRVETSNEARISECATLKELLKKQVGQVRGVWEAAFREPKDRNVHAAENELSSLKGSLQPILEERTKDRLEKERIEREAPSLRLEKERLEKFKPELCSWKGSAKPTPGIISYLTTKHRGNVDEKGIVTITSKSIPDDPRHALTNVADLNSLPYFASQDEPG
jgi:regulator of replication initiation timing